MLRKTLAFIPWMALLGFAHGQTRSADVLYTHFNSMPQRAYRVGDECFVPIDTVSSWGWKINTHGTEVEINAEGTTVNVTTRLIAGRPSIPVRKVISDLGGDSNWVATTDTLNILSPLATISTKGNRIKVSGPLAIKPVVSILNGPSRVMVDFVGAKLTTSTQKSLEGGTQVIQFRPDVVRLVMNTVGPVDLTQIDLTANAKFDLSLPEVVAQKPATVPTEPHTQAVQTPTIAGEVPKLTISAEDKSGVRVAMELPSALTVTPTISKPDPRTVEITVPGVFARLPEGFKLPTDSVVGVTNRIDGDNTIISFTLARAYGVQISQDANILTLVLDKYAIADGHLAGKVIVVDPGHGGKDRGAHVGDINEKDLNLSIGLKIAKKLTDAGATVILTRQTDVFIPLDERSNIANKNYADFFISTHINSMASGSRSGVITFHHKGREECKVLGECIQSEISKVSKLPNIGTWSDAKIYGSGFAVLRGTTMPGVLLELGFISHPTDRKRMIQSEYQDAVASAVVKGLKNFLGDNSK